MKPTLFAATLALLAPLPVFAEPIEVDVGLDRPVVVDNSSPPRIAYFIGATNNSALQESIRGAEAGAAEIGAEIDIFDAAWDTNRMVNQMQTGLLNGYDAWVVASPEGNQVCDMVSRQAPEANILVSVVLVPVCGRDAAEGNDLHVPGILTFVGGNETAGAFRAMIVMAAEQNPGPIRVGVLTGPDVNPLTKNFKAMLEDVAAEYPGFEVVMSLPTDFSVPQGLEKTTTLLQRYPDLDVLIAQHSNMTRGAMAALELAGLSDSVRVYDSGGTKWSVEQIREGRLQVSTGIYHFTNARSAVLAIGEAWKGEEVPGVILNDGAPLMEGQVLGQPPLITLSNVDQYTAEVE